MSKETRDLTSFLLEWRDTCAIDLCPATAGMSKGHPVYACKYKGDGETDEEYVAHIKEDVAYVHQLTDARFERLVRQIRQPDLVGLAKKRADEAHDTKRGEEVEKDSAKAEDEELDVPDDDCSSSEDEVETQQPEGDNSSFSRRLSRLESIQEDVFNDNLDNSAMEKPVIGQNKPIRARMISSYLDIVEGWRQEGRKKTHAFPILEGYLYEKRVISGRPFKNYLFEEIGTGKQRVGAIWGYLYKRVLSTMVDKSFEKNITLTGDDLVSSPPPPASDVLNREKDRVIIDVTANEAVEALEKWVGERWPGFTIDDKLALLCTILDVAKYTPDIMKMTTVGRQAFYNREKLAREVMEFLMSQGFDWKDCAKTLAGPFQKLLLTVAQKDPECKAFLVFFEKNRLKPGK